MVLFRQSGYIWAKVVVFGHVGLFGQKKLYSGRLVVFGQNGCIRAKWLSLGKSGYIRESGCILTKWLFLGNYGCIGRGRPSATFIDTLKRDLGTDDKLELEVCMTNQEDWRARRAARLRPP